MGQVDLNLMATQLAALARDLQDEVDLLGELEEAAVDAEAEHRRLAEAYEDAYSRAYVEAEGAVELRKNLARLQVIAERVLAQEAKHAADKARSKVKTQKESLYVLHKRVDVGRSLMARERALVSLSGYGEA